MPKSIQIAVDITAGDFAKDVEWLGSDYEVDDLGKFRFNIAVNTNSIVEYTIDSGTNWLKINGGDPLEIKVAYGFDIYVRAGDLLNFKSPTDGTNTVVLGRLDSIKDEG